MARLLTACVIGLCVLFIVGDIVVQARPKLTDGKLERTRRGVGKSSSELHILPQQGPQLRRRRKETKKEEQQPEGKEVAEKDLTGRPKRGVA